MSRAEWAWVAIFTGAFLGCAVSAAMEVQRIANALEVLAGLK